jgi:hypothetical protein
MADWNVTLQDFSASGTKLKFKASTSKVNDGADVTLTITLTAAMAKDEIQGVALVSTSADGREQHVWPIVVNWNPTP